MPYSRNSELPASVRNALPDHAQSIFRRVVNSSLSDGDSETSAFKQAWGAVKQSYHEKDGEWVAKATPRTLYISRKVINAREIIKWAKGQGFETTLPAEDMHVTICFSRAPVDWMKISEAYSPNDDASIEVKPGSVRLVEPLGDKGAIVLIFNSNELSWRHEDIKRQGATWDYDEYQPHITITYDQGDVDLKDVEPYRGKIVLGPEIFEEVNEDWADDVVEKNARVIKIDEELGLVFGWAIICKIDGEDYYDKNIDRDGPFKGERVPEHIPESTMLKAASSFMETARPGNEMHSGPDRGQHVFAFPLTTEIAKALGIKTKTTGLLVAYKPPSDVLEKFKDGTYTGFSIEGQVNSGGSEVIEHA